MAFISARRGLAGLVVGLVCTVIGCAPAPEGMVKGKAGHPASHRDGVGMAWPRAFADGIIFGEV